MSYFYTQQDLDLEDAIAQGIPYIDEEENNAFNDTVSYVELDELTGIKNAWEKFQDSF